MRLDLGSEVMQARVIWDPIVEAVECGPVMPSLSSSSRDRNPLFWYSLMLYSNVYLV
jgi:hypothetical protein